MTFRELPGSNLPSSENEPGDLSVLPTDARSMFFNLSLDNLKKYCTDRGFSSAHAAEIFRRVYKHLDPDLSEIVALPKALRQSVERDFRMEDLPVAVERTSESDGSIKFVFKLQDGSEVESVLMPETGRITLCISSQVGCAQGCVFCHTGRMGLLRNLSRGEMVAQVWSADRWLKRNPAWAQEQGFGLGQQVTNIVFMGMGEPLDNVEETAGALDIFCEPFGLNLTKRKISVSTAGHLDGLNRILALHPDVRLAISIHHPDDKERSRIMPINKKWPLPDLMALLRAHPWPKGVSLLIQYTLIGGVNDSVEDADKLVSLLEGLPVKINIIPWNPVSGSALREPSAEQLAAFRDRLYDAGLRVMVRLSKGRDIRAACGQLVTKSARRSNFSLSPNS